MGKDTPTKRKVYCGPNQGKRLKARLLFQVGRVCVVNFGPDVNKLCVLLDFIDSNDALITGPEGITGVSRQKISFKRLSMTPWKLNIVPGQTDGSVAKLFESDGIWAKWLKHPQYLKEVRKQRRLELTDFERFQVMLLKQRKSQLIYRHTLKFKRTGTLKPHKDKKQVEYWEAKRKGENPTYWKKSFPDEGKSKEEMRNLKHRDGKPVTRKRTRGKTRRKKKSEKQFAANKAHQRMRAKKKAQSARKVTNKVALRKPKRKMFNVKELTLDQKKDRIRGIRKRKKVLKAQIRKKQSDAAKAQN